MKRIYTLPLLSVLLPALSLTTAQAQSGDHITLGAGVAALPVYEGADDYRIQPFPVIDIKMGQFFASVADGVGVHVIDTPTFKIGGSVTYARGYRRRDIPTGIDRLSDAAGGRLFSSIYLGGAHLTVGATRIFGGGTRGTIADARISYPVHANDRMTIISTIATSWANEKHMDRYFGITTAEATASGLSAYRPSAGFKDATIAMTGIYRLSDNIRLTGSVGVNHLFNKAGDSPLVEQRWQPIGFLGLGYRF